jgi:hypothetical protein
MILRQTFPLPADTELTRAGEGAGAQNLDLARNGDRASGDWFASRSVQNHDLRRVTPTRARVDVVEGGRDGRPPVLQSSLGAALRAVVYRDKSGQFWKADELPPGRRVTLAPAPGDRVPDRLPAFPIAPGCFYAEGGPSDLAPLPTLPSIRWTDRSIHYTGAVQEVQP